jgi:hypothetical protein
VIRLLRENLATNLLRFPQPPGAKILHRQFERLLNRHRVHVAIPTTYTAQNSKVNATWAKFEIWNLKSENLKGHD